MKLVIFVFAKLNKTSFLNPASSENIFYSTNYSKLMNSKYIFINLFIKNENPFYLFF